MKGLFTRGTSAISIFVVFAILFSIGLHSAQIAHDHPGHTTDHSHAEHHGSTNHEHQEHGSETSVLGEYTHASEKKLLIILTSLALLAFGFTATLFGSWEQFMLGVSYHYQAVFRYFKSFSAKLFNFLSQCFRLGILHPKCH